MRLIPINETLEDNRVFTSNPVCSETIHLTIDYYKKVGFVPPWIGYYAEENSELVGAAEFKGPPLNGTIEITHGTFEKYQNQGVGSEICRHW